MRMQEEQMKQDHQVNMQCKAEQAKHKIADSKKPPEKEPAKKAPLKKSVSNTHHAQPTTEQFEQAIAQQFPDLPKNEDELKKKEEEWNQVFGKLNDLSKPVEKVQKMSVGRGAVDQDDDSSLTEEERRIRAIPVNPSLLEDE
jgi:hypothetical protein